MRKVLLAGIIILAFLLRVPLLDKYPIGFTPDEASFGYDAYSILKTGKDQWGQILPLVLESFGDFKAPLYSYLDIPFVTLFGLTKVATRLPNAILGVGAILVVYLFVCELFGGIKKNNLSFSIHQQSWPSSAYNLALIASFMLAISPWHIMLSRGAFEANLTTFFLPLGILLFLKGLKTPKYLLFSSLIFGLNLFTYHSAKVTTPLVILVLVTLFAKKLLKVSKKYLIYSLTLLVLFGMLTAYTFTLGAGRRVADVGLFNGALEAQAEMRLQAINSGTSPAIARLVYNKFVVAGIRFYYNYKQYFTPSFLFTKGVGETTYGMLPGVGVLYRFELFTLIIFLVFLWKHRREKILWFILLWILIAPIPAGLTMGVGYAGNRAAGMMPAIQIASSIGLYYFLTILTRGSSLKIKFLGSFGLAILLILSLVTFLKMYMFDSPKIAAKGMLYGDLEVAYWLKENAEDSLKVVVSRKLSEPHIFIAFAAVWDPGNYHKQTLDWNRYKDENLVFLDQLHRYYLGKYVFQTITASDLHENTQTLLVGRPDEFPSDSRIVKKINYPDGNPSLFVVQPFGDLYAQSN